MLKVVGSFLINWGFVKKEQQKIPGEKKTKNNTNKLEDHQRVPHVHSMN